LQDGKMHKDLKIFNRFFVQYDGGIFYKIVPDKGKKDCLKVKQSFSKKLVNSVN
jgi:hypothetical protein